MLIFTRIDDLQAHLKALRAKGLSLGFVPTMGALHMGHISLINASKAACEITICSIFVNPRQFNDQNDLNRYPRMPEKDAEMLKVADCSILFLPSVEEVYPDANIEKFSFGHLDEILEAHYRPGHFNGVAQVLKRFFEIIQPDKAFFGVKDYQQVLVVKSLVKSLGLTVQIVSCPILREPDGLAMSSRNALLNPSERVIARLIPNLMTKAKEIVITKGIAHARNFIEGEIRKVPIMRMDYFEVCASDTLEPVYEYSSKKQLVCLIAVFVGKIRLIDNLQLNS